MELFTREDYLFNLSWDKVGNEEDILIDLEDRLSEDTEVDIENIVTEVADANIEIYTQSLWDLAPIIENWIEEALMENGFGRGDSLDQVFQWGQYIYNIELIEYNLDYVIHNVACDILEDLIEEKLKSGELSGTDIEVLGGNIADYLQLNDINYGSDIVDSMENLMEDYENGGL